MQFPPHFLHYMFIMNYNFLSLIILVECVTSVVTLGRWFACIFIFLQCCGLHL